jgi:hypothetical protein
MKVKRVFFALFLIAGFRGIKFFYHKGHKVKNHKEHEEEKFRGSQKVNISFVSLASSSFVIFVVNDQFRGITFFYHKGPKVKNHKEHEEEKFSCSHRVNISLCP